MQDRKEIFPRECLYRRLMPTLLKLAILKLGNIWLQTVSNHLAGMWIICPMQHQNRRDNVGECSGIQPTFLASKLGGWSAIQSWEITGAGLALSAIIGLIFGLYPALKAAAMEPIQALRTE